MKLNVHIIADELKIPKAKMLTDDRHVLNLTGFELADFGSELTLSENLLYIATAADISEFSDGLSAVNLLVVGQIKASVAAELMLRSCNLLICEDLTIMSAVNRVLNIFSKYSAWNEQVLEACLSNRPTDEIFDIIAEVFKNPLDVLDSSNAPVPATGKIPAQIKDTLWAYLKSNDKSSAESTSVETYEPPSSGQLSLLKHIKELMEFRTRSSSGNIFKSEDSTFVFAQLIRGVYVDEGLIISQLKNRHWVIDDSYYVLYLIKNEEDALINGVDLSKVLLNQYFPQGIILVFKQFISIILRESDYPYLNINKHLTFNQYMSECSLICGVSQIFTDLKQLHTYYKQSQIATNYCKSKISGNNMYFFYDYYFDYLIEELKPSVKWSVISDPRVVALKRYDENNSTEFVKTLFHFLRSGSNLQETATSLYIHRNTLSNRLRQIKEQAEIDLEAENDIDQILISCMLMLRNDLE